MQISDYRDGEIYIRILPTPLQVTKEQKVGHKFKAKTMEFGIVEDTNGFFHNIKSIEPAGYRKN